MEDKEGIGNILNAYRSEIMAKSPKSLSIWQANRQVMPAGVGSSIPPGRSLSDGG